MSKETEPKLNAAQFRLYNNLAVKMEYFHNKFREKWNQIYDTVDPGNSSTKQLSVARVITVGQQFIAQIGIHHDIEEQYVFPLLGQKMPAFQAGGFAKLQHQQIHEGLNKLEEYLKGCQRGERELRRNEVKRIMDSFAGVLWTHLDEEVQQLEADNMVRFWSEAEMEHLHL